MPQNPAFLAPHTPESEEQPHDLRDRMMDMARTAVARTGFPFVAVVYLEESQAVIARGYLRVGWAYRYANELFDNGAIQTAVIYDSSTWVWRHGADQRWIAS